VPGGHARIGYRALTASWQGFEDRRRRKIAEESLQYVYYAFEAAMGGLRAPAGPPARLPWCRRRRSHAPAVLRSRGRGESARPAAYADLVGAVIAGGHYVANHTFTHPIPDQALVLDRMCQRSPACSRLRLAWWMGGRLVRLVPG
jgi:hypothetical protein